MILARRVFSFGVPSSVFVEQTRAGSQQLLLVLVVCGPPFGQTVAGRVNDGVCVIMRTGVRAEGRGGGKGHVLMGILTMLKRARDEAVNDEIFKGPYE